MELRIGKHTISNAHPMYVIAEIGVNHNGSLETAKEMIVSARDCGADAVKFQMFRSEDLVSDQAALVEYQKASTSDSTQLEMLRRLELDESAFLELKSFCDTLGVTFLATPFDTKSAYTLNQMGIEAFKIGSGDITNLQLLAAIGSFHKPVVLSTGMTTLGEIETALAVLKQAPKVALLHCTSAYPAPYDSINLRVIETLKPAFGGIIGYSDHSVGMEVPIAAAALGYKILEKHFTLDRTMPGPDHQASMEPDPFKRMIEAIRHVELALGITQKRVTEVEEQTRELVRRGVYAGKDLPAGHVIQEADLQLLRPLGEIDAAQYKQLLGKKTTHSFKKGEPLSWLGLA
ncbi:N-acetylneuraminate synthase [Bacillus sp. FJAT-28004]|uniref:N-acetylneuraminate synthase n=1 Tax=Bacillus sp. FJAT-28004 TaxID=1679165 RepID=UPI0006B5A4B2|nr:N-acetylneuraminate synthase [Bacillus sp. FJAT-28004]